MPNKKSIKSAKKTIPLNNDKIQPQKNKNYTVYSGIGINFKRINEKYIITDVFKGMPAQKAGLYKDDEIISLDGHPTSDMDKRTFNSKISNSKTNSLILKYKPAGSVDTIKELIIKRDIIETNKTVKKK